MSDKDKILEQNNAQKEALEIICPHCSGHNRILFLLVDRFSKEMRDVLNKDEHATPQDIVDGIEKVEHEDPKEIAKKLIK